MALPADFYYFTRDPDTGAVSVLRTPAISVLTTAMLAAQGVTVTGRRPCIVPFRGDVYVVGCWSRPVYFTPRDPGWWLTGIRPPNQVITLANGGGGALTGTFVGYITYQHRAGDVLLAESNPSNYVVLTIADGSRAWGNLTTPTVEKRVTHVAAYVSANGSNYRRAWLAPYGVASYVEQVPAASLTIEGPDGNYLPPSGVAFAAEFAGRMWYAGSPEHPYRAWYSDAGNPQYVGLANFRDTLDRDTITGIANVQGVFVIFTIAKAYVIRASGTGFQLERLDSSFGCLSHFGILEIHNKLWFPTQDGIGIYDGAGFWFAMKDMRPYWQADYLENPDAFLNSFAVNDKIGKNYFLMTQRPALAAFEDWSPGTVIYVGNYLNFERTMGGTNPQPDWSIDLRRRIDYSAFYGLDNRLYFGSEDGKLRIEDPADNNDDGDTLAKPCLIEHGCMLFMEPGDDVEHGKTLHQLWAYVESETTAWSMYVLMGDEWAENQLEPDNELNNWKIDVPASALTQIVRDDDGGTQVASFIAESVHHLGPEGVAGRGLAIRLRATSPVGLKYRGIGGTWARGGAPRKASIVNRFTLKVSGAPVLPNTAANPIVIAAEGGQPFVVTLDNPNFVVYPVPVSFTWSGDHVEFYNDDPILSGLVSPAVPFDVSAGSSMLVVQVVLGAYTLSKTFYFEAV